MQLIEKWIGGCLINLIMFLGLSVFILLFFVYFLSELSIKRKLSNFLIHNIIYGVFLVIHIAEG